MQILLWLVPAAVATVVAMCVAGWLGRERPTTQRQQERADQRFARAMERPMTTGARVHPARVRSTGIAVRTPRRAHTAAEQRIGPV